MNGNLAHKSELSEDKQQPVVELELITSKIKMDPLDQIINKKTKREHIKDFGFVMASFFALIACYQTFMHTDRNQAALILSFVSCCFYLGAIYLPRAMMPVFSGWMFIGKYLEVVSTFVLLGLMWMVTFLPIGLIFRLIGKSTMTLKLDKNAVSYWEDCDQSRADFKLLERQY